MRITAGYFYDGKSSRRQAAELHAEAGILSLRMACAVLIGGTVIDEVEISPRIGNTPRYLRFPDGGTFECTDNGAIDRLVITCAPEDRRGLLHVLETRKRYIFTALVLVVAFTVVGVGWGIPALTRTVAYALPAAASDVIDKGVLEFLDSQLLAASELPEARQEELQAYFSPFVQNHQGEFRIRVLFRHGGEVGPNAMALPSGSIIFTDELVALAESDEELAAVLLHEIGHVVNRHGLRQAMQGSLLAILVAAVTGDVSSLSSLITTLPVVLTQLGYSRDFEREADRFALEGLRAHGIAPQRFATILRHIEQASKCEGHEAEAAAKPYECEAAGGSEPDGELSSYLSTHPPTEERLREFH